MDKPNKIKKGFARPPLSLQEKEKLARNFIDGARGGEKNELEEREVNKVAITIRIPEYYLKDIDRIQRLTGQTKNAIYIEILRNAIKLKLKELEEG
jgi:hypothetical protein